MMFKAVRVLTVAACAAATSMTPATMLAQTWQTIGVPNQLDTGPYWNQPSDDSNGSTVCHIGGILTNTPAPPAGCANQSPPFLPLNPAPLTTSNLFLGGTGGMNPGAFRFAAGTYNINLIGRVAGTPSTSWGVILDNGTVFTAAQLSTGSTVLSGPFAVWITQALPAAGAGTVYTSTQSTGAVAIGSRAASINQQFAVFTNGSGSGTLGGLSQDAFGTIINSRDGGARYYVGMEDNVNGGRGFGVAGPGLISDRDYNDIIISIQAVPEPETVLLMAVGLAMLGMVVVKRRRV